MKVAVFNDRRTSAQSFLRCLTVDRILSIIFLFLVFFPTNLQTPPIHHDKSIIFRSCRPFPINGSVTGQLLAVTKISSLRSKNFFDKQKKRDLRFDCPSERSLEDVGKKPIERSVANVNGREDGKSALVTEKSIIKESFYGYGKSIQRSNGP